MKLRPHVKMLAGDYLCFSTLARERGSNPECKLCPSSPHRPSPAVDMIHILTRCRGTADTRQRMVPELFNTVSKYFPLNNLLIQQDHAILTQFILDSSSPNLHNLTRIDRNHPDVHLVVRTCRDFCYAIHTDRVRLLKSLGLMP